MTRVGPDYPQIAENQRNAVSSRQAATPPGYRRRERPHPPSAHTAGMTERLIH
jgi:hypothetical protein